MEIFIGFPMTNSGKGNRRFGENKGYKNFYIFISVTRPFSFRSIYEEPGLSGQKLLLLELKGKTGGIGLSCD